jgi:hypothetical protein
MTGKLLIVGGLGLWISAVHLRAASTVTETEPKNSFEVTRTERVPFVPGGTIRLNDSYGYLSVDGWDEPEVEITVIKSTERFYERSESERAQARLGRIEVKTVHRSDRELAITTMRAPSKSEWLPPFRRTTEAGITVEYRIRVPRSSHLAIHHDNGYVWVSDVTGEIEVHSHTGDMVVMLPDPGSYAIDAKTRVGSISSDFEGRHKSEFLLGTHFAFAGETPLRRIHLRMGRGSITVLKSAPIAPNGKN